MIVILKVNVNFYKTILDAFFKGHSNAKKLPWEDNTGR